MIHNYKALQEHLKYKHDIPDGYKLTVTNEALDRWIAAHYPVPGGVMPSSKPHDMPEHVFEALKRHFKRKEANERKHELERSKYRRSTINVGVENEKPVISSPFIEVKPTEDCQPVKDYRHLVYPDNMHVKSLASIHMRKLKMQEAESA